MRNTADYTADCKRYQRQSNFISCTCNHFLLLQLWHVLYLQQATSCRNSNHSLMTLLMGSSHMQCSAIYQQPNTYAGIVNWLQPHLADTLSSATLFPIGAKLVPAQLKNGPPVGRIFFKVPSDAHTKFTRQKAQALKMQDGVGIT